MKVALHYLNKKSKYPHYYVQHKSKATIYIHLLHFNPNQQLNLHIYSNASLFTVSNKIKN